MGGAFARRYRRPSSRVGRSTHARGHDSKCSTAAAGFPKLEAFSSISSEEAAVPHSFFQRRPRSQGVLPMSYQIREVDGVTFSDTINAFNKLVPEWPVLQQRHFTKGYWWLAYLEESPVAFAGLVPFEPFPNIGYLKRCYVNPDHHGHGLQFRLMVARESKAKQLGWTHLVSECRVNNKHSTANFTKAGYIQCEPEQPWERDSVYWVKAI
jgi:GNAT superfamily N-acetyltransferase